MKLPFLWVDAFTTTRFGGNPCAVVFDADALTTAQMQIIAQEMNLSETAFVVKSTTADFGARYFTPASEIPLAGHPTLATIHALIDRGRIKLSGSHTRVRLELKAGLIPIDIDRELEGNQITMQQNRPMFLSKHDAKVIAPLFGLTPDDLVSHVPVQTVSTGTPQLMVCVKNLDALRRATISGAAYKAYQAQSNFFSPHLFCVEGATSAGQTFARHLGVAPEPAEDPFTGSATGGMAAYLWHHGLIHEPNFIAEQGHWIGRPGSAKVEVLGLPQNIEAVRVGGKAVTVIRGEIDV